MNKCLTFTAFNRPAYLRESLSSWEKAGSLEEWETAYHLEPSDVQSHMAQALNDSLAKSKKFYPSVNPRNFGVLLNPYVALSTSFDRGNDFTVLAEDDIIVSSDTLSYFDWAMEYYKDNPEILGVLAFSRLPEGYSDDSNEVWKTEVFCPLVWGTWKDRWDDLIKSNWDLNYSTGKPDGSEAGWDWNMMRLAVRNGMKFTFPEYSRSNHIGRFGGTHTCELDFPGSQAMTFSLNQVRKKDFVATNHYYHGI